MTTKLKGFGKKRQQRIDDLIAGVSAGWLEIGWVKRSLAVVAVVSSWTYLFSIYPQFLTDSWLVLGALRNLKPLAFVLMIASFLMLRSSVRRISSLPKEHLDERETADRDWAYRSGYLVVRRIGLGITALLGAALISYHFIRLFLINPEDFPEALHKLYMFAGDFIKGFFLDDPIGQTVSLIGLLTYVAYSFPVILLAWRDAKNYNSVETSKLDVANIEKVINRAVSGYYGGLLKIGVGIVAILVISGTPELARNYNGIYAFVVTVFYAVYVYLTGLFSSSYAAKVMGHPGAPEAISKSAANQRSLFVAASLAGVSIPIAIGVLFLTPLWGWLWAYMFCAGIVTLGLQLTSFANLKALVARTDDSQ